MKKLPWKKDDSKKLVNDRVEFEMQRCLDIMETHEVDSEEYKQAFIMFRNLKQSLEGDVKIDANKRSRIVEILATLGLSVVTLTAEQWTPLTSKWWSSIIKQIRGRDL